MTVRPRRSVLYMPGSNARALEKAKTLAADTLILDLEDAVHFTGQVPQADAQRLVKRTSASISPRFDGNNTPMKIYQLMGDGIPLIATRIESHTQSCDGAAGDPPASAAKAIRRPSGAHREFRNRRGLIGRDSRDRDSRSNSTNR